MDRSPRFASFYSRVDFERAVLRAANLIAGSDCKLHGLTPHARSVWLHQIPEGRQKVALGLLLDGCWEELGKMSDHSRNVFEVRPERPDVRVELLDRIYGLKEPLG